MGDRQAQRPEIGHPRGDARRLLGAGSDGPARGSSPLLRPAQAVRPGDGMRGPRQHELQCPGRAHRLHAGGRIPVLCEHGYRLPGPGELHRGQETDVRGMSSDRRRPPEAIWIGLKDGIQEAARSAAARSGILERPLLVRAQVEEVVVHPDPPCPDHHRDPLGGSQWSSALRVHAVLENASVKACATILARPPLRPRRMKARV